MINLFEKPLIQTKSFFVGGNKLILSQFTAKFYLDHVIDADAVDGATAKEGSAEARIDVLRSNNDHYLRFSAASIAQDFLKGGETLEEESVIVEEVYQNLKDNLTADALAALYSEVLKLQGIGVGDDQAPKQRDQEESLPTDSAES